MITTKDKEQLKLKGISEASFEEQLNHFKTGFPYLKISAAASVEKGIVRPDEAQLAELEQEWQNYVEEGHTILKFVPASGAASRMFKNSFSLLFIGYLRLGMRGSGGATSGSQWQNGGE